MNRRTKYVELRHFLQCKLPKTGTVMMSRKVRAVSFFLHPECLHCPFPFYVYFSPQRQVESISAHFLQTSFRVAADLHAICFAG